MDDTDDREELVDRLMNGEGEVKGFSIPEGPGMSFVAFLKEVEERCRELEKQDDKTKRNMYSVMTSSLEIAHAMFTLHFYSLPFYHMHKNQSFPDNLFDEEAKKLCAVIAADLSTLKTVATEATGSMERLRKHLDPVFKKLKANETRKESFDTGAATSETTSNVIDFEERRGQRRKETLH